MDHREQMQKEAEQWQKNSVKLIQGVRYGIAALAILGVLILLLQNLGFPKQIDERLPVYMVTEDGELFFRAMWVDIRGEITHYPLNPEKYSADDQLAIYANGKRLVQIYCNQDGDDLFARRGDTVCVLSRQRDGILLETELQNIFPDMESQRCLLYTDYDSFDLPGEYAGYFTLLQK